MHHPEIGLLSRFGRTELGQTAPQEAVAIKRVGWYRQVLESLYRYDGTAAAKRVRCPVLALHGSDDKLISLDMARTIPALVPGADLRVIEGAGHTLVFANADQVVAAVREACLRPEEHSS